MFPPTRFTPVVFSILSSLAEGADRFAVQLALDADSDFQVELGAVLPMSVEDYCEDFDCESEKEFHTLLARAAATEELQPGSLHGCGKRDAAYANAGRYIVERSDILIAAWDGCESMCECEYEGCKCQSQHHAGTTEVVEYAREKGVPVLVVHAINADNREPIPLANADFTKAVSREDSPRNAFRRMDSYNRVSLSSKPVCKKTVSERARLGRPLECTPLYGRYMQVADWALPQLARADRLAVVNHGYHRKLAWTIHLLAAFAVADVAVQTIFFSNRPILLTGEIALVVGLILAVFAGRHVRLHDRWIGYRSLTEAFRSALFLSLSGNDDTQRVGTVLGTPKEPWFQRAFSQAWRSSPEIELDRGDAAALRSFLLEAWIDHQIDYHNQTADHARKLHNLYTWTMGILAVATIAVALAHILKAGSGSWVESTLKLAAFVLPAFGGAIAGMREYGQLRLHEERSRRVAIRLEALKETLAISSTLASVRRLATEAQRLTVDENMDWYGVVEFQDIDIVI